MIWLWVRNGISVYVFSVVIFVSIFCSYLYKYYLSIDFIRIYAELLRQCVYDSDILLVKKMAFFTDVTVIMDTHIIKYKNIQGITQGNNNIPKVSFELFITVHYYNNGHRQEDDDKALSSYHTESQIRVWCDFYLSTIKSFAIIGYTSVNQGRKTIYWGQKKYCYWYRIIYYWEDLPIILQ